MFWELCQNGSGAWNGSVHRRRQNTRAGTYNILSRTSTLPLLRCDARGLEWRRKQTMKQMNRIEEKTKTRNDQRWSDGGDLRILGFDWGRSIELRTLMKLQTEAELADMKGMQRRCHKRHSLASCILHHFDVASGLVTVTVMRALDFTIAGQYESDMRRLNMHMRPSQTRFASANSKHRRSGGLLSLPLKALLPLQQFQSQTERQKQNQRPS